MNTKLTLNMDKALVEKMKIYAKRKNISLSLLVKNYFSSLVSDKEPKNDFEPTALVKSLSGILPSATDKKEYYDYLDKKYG